MDSHLKEENTVQRVELVYAQLYQKLRKHKEIKVVFVAIGATVYSKKENVVA